MSEFKGTKGEWKKVFHKKTEYTQETYTIEYGEDGECVSEWVQNEYDALLISKAPEMLKILNSIIAQINNEHVSDYLIQIQEEAKQLIKEATEL